MGDGDFVAPLSVQELTDLDLKSSLFTAHASERVDERYSENMQELLRSFNANQYLAFRATRRRINCGCLRIECTPDLKHILSLQTETSTRVTGSHQQLVGISHLRNEVEAWCLRHAPDSVSSLDFESCKLIGDIVRIQVVTTTTRFILNKECSHVVTVIKLKKSFGEWRKGYEMDLKRREKKRFNKYGL